MADDKKKKDSGGGPIILLGLMLFGVVAWQVSQHSNIKAGADLLPGGVRGIQNDTSNERPTTWVDVLERTRQADDVHRVENGGLHR